MAPLFTIRRQPNRSNQTQSFWVIDIPALQNAETKWEWCVWSPSRSDPPGHGALALIDLDTGRLPSPSESGQMVGRDAETGTQEATHLS